MQKEVNLFYFQFQLSIDLLILMNQKFIIFPFKLDLLEDISFLSIGIQIKFLKL